MFRKNKDLFILLFLTLIAGLFRFWQINHYPVSLNWDEVSHGYNAYSILKTGRDEWGSWFPIIFRAFGDYKLPVYIYLTVLPVWLLGLNPISVRFISALAGTLAIPAIYLLAKQILPQRHRRAALLAPFFLAFSSWHFFISRPALEANLSLTLIIAGVGLLIAGLKKSSSALFGGLCLLAISMQTYNSARVFVPSLLFIAALIYFKKLKFSRSLILGCCCLLISIGLILFQLQNGTGLARFSQLSLLKANDVYQIGQARQNSHLAAPLARLLYNRPVFVVSRVLTNYSGFFSLSFYRQTASPQIQFALPGEFLVSPLLLTLALLGLLGFLVRRTPSEKLIFSWLILAPLPAALTDAPLQALRPLYLIPALIIFALLGLTFLLEFIHGYLRPLLLILIICLPIYDFGLYLSQYYSSYAHTYSQSWQYGYQEAMTYVNQHQTNYDHVFITKKYGEPHLFYAFYSKLNPQKMFPGNDNLRFKQSDWYWTDKLGQVYFVNDWNIPNLTEASSLKLESGGVIATRHSLLITSPDHLPSNVLVLQTIKFLDGKPDFIIAKFP